MWKYSGSSPDSVRHPCRSAGSQVRQKFSHRKRRKLAGSRHTRAAHPHEYTLERTPKAIRPLRHAPSQRHATEPPRETRRSPDSGHLTPAVACSRSSRRAPKRLRTSGSPRRTSPQRGAPKRLRTSDSRRALCVAFLLQPTSPECAQTNPHSRCSVRARTACRGSAHRAEAARGRPRCESRARLLPPLLSGASRCVARRDESIPRPSSASPRAKARYAAS